MPLWPREKHLKISYKYILSTLNIIYKLVISKGISVENYEHNKFFLMNESQTNKKSLKIFYGKQ